MREERKRERERTENGDHTSGGFGWLWRGVWGLACAQMLVLNTSRLLLLHLTEGAHERRWRVAKHWVSKRGVHPGGLYAWHSLGELLRHGEGERAKGLVPELSLYPQPTTGLLPMERSHERRNGHE